MIRVIGHYKAFTMLGVFTLLQMIVVDDLKDLSCFATRSRTHVQDGVMRFYVAQNWWHHTHNFLSCQKPRIFRIVDYLVNFFETFVFLQKLFWDH